MCGPLQKNPTPFILILSFFSARITKFPLLHYNSGKYVISSKNKNTSLVFPVKKCEVLYKLRPFDQDISCDQNAHRDNLFLYVERTEVYQSIVRK